MDMHTGLDAFFDRSWLGLGDQTSTRPYDFMNYGTKLDKVRISQLFGRLVIQVNEEPKFVGFLLDHVKFLTGAYGLYVGLMELVRLLRGNGQDTPVHEDVGRRPLGDAPSID